MNNGDVTSALFNRREVVVIQYVLGPLPKYNLFPHDLLAVVAQIFQRRLMASTRLPRNWFCILIALTEVFKLNPNKEMLQWKFLEVLVCILGTDLPTVHFKLVAVTYKSSVKRHSEYFGVTRYFAVFEHNHDISVQVHILFKNW